MHHLRNHIAVVSQTPNLFYGTIRENTYGLEGTLFDVDIARATRAANVHDFVLSLSQVHDTLIGENASLMSGGQAQRLQIARALARPLAHIHILDECTSALDGANQAAVLEAIRGARVPGRTATTTVMVTHKVEVMKMCDRMVVLDGGEEVEEVGYEELVEKGVVFARLASGSGLRSDSAVSFDHRMSLKVSVP